MGEQNDKRANIKYLPISGLVRGTPCLIEKAWICLNLNLEEAQLNKRAMHFLRIYDLGHSGQVDVDDIVEDKCFVELWVEIERCLTS